MWFSAYCWCVSNSSLITLHLIYDSICDIIIWPKDEFWSFIPKILQSYPFIWIILSRIMQGQMKKLN